MIPMLLLTALLVHENGVSSSRLDIRGREIRVRFTFSLEDLAGLARLDLDRDGSVSREEWRRVFPSLLSYVSGHFQIECDGVSCVATGDATLLPPPVAINEGRTPVSLELIYRSPGEIAGLRIRCTLFQEHGGNPRHIAELSGGSVIIFDRDRTESEGTGVQQRSKAIGYGVWGVLMVGITALGIASIRRTGAPRTPRS